MSAALVTLAGGAALLLPIVTHVLALALGYLAGRAHELHRGRRQLSSYWRAIRATIPRKERRPFDLALRKQHAKAARRDIAAR